jgi:hypothetical protein
MKKLISILRYGKIHIGLNKKPKLCAAYAWYNCDHWILHIGWVWIELEH